MIMNAKNFFAGLLMLAAATNANAALEYIYPVTIEQILVAGDPTTMGPGDTPFGGCMIRITPSAAATVGLEECNNWLTMSCSGFHTSKSAAQGMLSQAQLAMVTGEPALVLVNSLKRHNTNFCFVERIDTVPAGGTPQ